MVSLVFRLNYRSGLCSTFDVALQGEEMLALE
jgi:hypothetical protein